ncbi:MAG: DUF5309 family protein [Oscillospiraceae bacterium]|nr:DUF5309 family protein [Oscillospiraceae bacterium]
MPNAIDGTGNTWNLPNYAGELFTCSPTKTPLLSMIGGLTGGMKTENDEFSTGVLYEFPDATQPSISETASETAPAATAIAREQKTNVTQIFHETISIAYAKMANRGKLSGLNTAGQKANPANELDWQVAKRLEKIARDVEYTFLNGVYQKSTGANVPNKTRGMLELCSDGTTIDASGADLSLSMLKALYKEMADAGAAFGNMVLFCNSYQKQIITALYEKQLGYNAAAPRNVGGMNITEIENDFFKLGICYDPFMPTGSILIADIAAIAPVFQDVPGKGVLFLEDLAKTGAAEKKQIYGEIGLAHGPAFLHGSITGLKTE